MKRIMIILISCIFILSCKVSAQFRNDTISNIDKKVLSISQSAAEQVITLKNENFLDSGFLHQPGMPYGQLKGFINNKNINLIIENLGIEIRHDFATTEYYFENGKLIYVYEKERVGPDIFIDSAGVRDERKERITFEGRYYFFNQKLIKTLKTGKQETMLLPNEEFFDSQSKEGQLLQSAERYFKLLSKK